MCSSEELPCFFCDPDWSHQQINWPLKKCRMVSLNLVTQKEKNPAAGEETRAPNPFREDEKYNPQKNHGNANPMEQLVPAG